MLRKCLVSILIISCLNSFAQAGDPTLLDQRISISFSNVSLASAIRQLKNQAKIRFSFNTNIIPRTTKIISTYRQETLRQILDDLLLEANLYYKEVNGNIVIKKRVFNDKQLIGQVIDVDTKAPLPFANVFIDNSVLGVATDQDGNFVLGDLPDRTFDLVVSYLGYESKMVPLQFDPNNADAPVTIALKVIPNELETFTVKAPPPKKVEKRLLRRFEEEFLGRSANSKKCRIANPDVLDLEVIDGNSHYKVTADAPVVVENLALGYRITYNLDEFIFENGAQTTKGTARFKELQPKSRKQNRS